jgi:uncharacterized protein (TIGR03437 family)
MSATTLIGQSSFSGGGSGSDNNRFNTPRQISIDTDDRLYVADTGNNRVQIFGRISQLGSDPSAVLTLRTGLNAPRGVTVSPKTGEVWVSDTGNGRLLRYQRFDVLFAIGDSADYQITPDRASGTITNAPLGTALDQFNNLYVGELVNRVTMYFPKVSACNGASFISRTLTPGLIATASTVPDRACGGEDLVYAFTDKTRSFDSLPNPIPMPVALEDIQVLFNGQPVPLYFISPFQINFLVPNGAPSSGNVELQVIQPSTGRIIGVTQVPMAPASPGLFTTTFEQGTSATPAFRQIAAINEDGTINSKANPAIRGKFVSLYATGVGYIPGAPPDGTPATGPTESPARVRVAVGTAVVEPGPDINYSGLAPTLVGVWQINVRIPELTAPGDTVVGLVVGDITGVTRQNGFLTSIQVK